MFVNIGQWSVQVSNVFIVVPDISRPKNSRHYFDALNEREIGR
jgi:hypothetical protein